MRRFVYKKVREQKSSLTRRFVNEKVCLQEGS